MNVGYFIEIKRKMDHSNTAIYKNRYNENKIDVNRSYKRHFFFVRFLNGN